MFFKHFGAKPTADDIARYAQSPNWKDGAFQNMEATELGLSFTQLPKVIYKQFSNGKGKAPEAPLPILPFDQSAFLAEADKAKFIWYGHAVVLLRLEGKTLLIDPMLGSNTTPIAPFPTRRFSENTLDLIDQFPAIDVVLLTHDHYDHLDYASIQKLKPKVKQYWVALGVKRHLVSWGVDGERITEFDWWEQQALGAIQITFTPTRHFSGRGLTDRQKSLWGGWVFKTPTENIWFSGDGGYGQHFTEIGNRLGPFDFAFMECGQYNDYWHPIHLFPEESVQAALDAQVKKAMPFHWAGFPLSFQHTWQEPADVFVASAKAKGLAYAVPQLGALFGVDSQMEGRWW
jgi:L-ascorbate metabolism protein UlaG (beta-lactamase superfamily)